MTTPKWFQKQERELRKRLEFEQLVVKEYEGGHTVRELTQIHSMSYGGVYDLLKRNDCKMRGRGRRKQWTT
jgi:hypothetical protein